MKKNGLEKNGERGLNKRRLWKDKKMVEQGYVSERLVKYGPRSRRGTRAKVEGGIGVEKV